MLCDVANVVNSDLWFRLGFLSQADMLAANWLAVAELFQYADDAAQSLASTTALFLTDDASVDVVAGTAVYTLPAGHIFTESAWLLSVEDNIPFVSSFSFPIGRAAGVVTFIPINAADLKFGAATLNTPGAARVFPRLFTITRVVLQSDSGPGSTATVNLTLVAQPFVVGTPYTAAGFAALDSAIAATASGNTPINANITAFAAGSGVPVPAGTGIAWQAVSGSGAASTISVTATMQIYGIYAGDTADVQLLRLTSDGQLFALDGRWATKTGTPTRLSLDAVNARTAALYPAPVANATLNLIAEIAPPAVAAGSSVLPISDVLEMYFSTAIVAGVLARESDHAKPEVAAHLVERLKLLDEVVKSLWGSGR